jgi:hypothetical protein
MSSRPYQSRWITCEVCGHGCRAVQKDRDICRACLRKEPSTCCRRCGLMRHRLAEETGLCPRCAARPEAVCARCLRTSVIYNQEKQLCRVCNKFERQRVRNKDKQIKVKCSVCGEMRYSQLLGRAICPACWTAERNGRGICSACNKLKVIWVKTEQLCKQCYKDHLAPNSLRRYVAEFTTPYPYNKVLFDLLVTTIDWQSVDNTTYQQFRSFGRFLQQQQLKEPLTWETIEEALPALGPTNRTFPQLIRSCLLELGHLLAARGELESREAYIERRYALLPLKRAPEHMQELLRRYVDWLLERRTTLSSVRSHLKILAPFWSWCEQRGIRSPEEVQASLVNDYLMTLYWQWRCSLCQSTMELEPSDRSIPRTCVNCRAIGSFTKERRYAQNTVRECRAKLLVFFDWLKINRMVVANPVQRKTPAPSPTIQHYPPEVIRQLCRYITAPDADPVEALVLYLIIFHALSVWELQHVEIPTILTLRKDIQQPGLAEAYYVIVPKPAPSPGDRSPGRPDVRLDFPVKAASWLRPLLDRYECHRQQLVSNQRNRYLFITSSTAHRNVPVGHVFIWKTVRDASIRLLDAACNPNILRKTAGVMFADQAGAGVLRWMGWDDQQAFAYAWAPREVIQPQQLDGSQDAHSRPGVEPITFPSPKQKTRKNDSGLSNYLKTTKRT